jgi:hypothetical protein
MNFGVCVAEAHVPQGFARFLVLKKPGMKCSMATLERLAGAGPVQRVSGQMPLGSEHLQLRLPSLEFCKASGNLLRIFSMHQARQGVYRARETPKNQPHDMEMSQLFS